jgi:hypothetical protein
VSQYHDMWVNTISQDAVGPIGNERHAESQAVRERYGPGSNVISCLNQREGMTGAL